MFPLPLIILHNNAIALINKLTNKDYFGEDVPAETIYCEACSKVISK